MTEVEKKIKCSLASLNEAIESLKEAKMYLAEAMSVSITKRSDIHIFSNDLVSIDNGISRVKKIKEIIELYSKDF